MKPLRIAVIGAGYWGPNPVRDLNEAPDADPVAVADRHIDAALTKKGAST